MGGISYRSWLGRVVSVTERHPYWSNARIAACASRKEGHGLIHPRHVEAARIYLGAPFPELAGHNERQWLLWGVASMMGLRPTMEATCNCEGHRRRADLFVTTRTGHSLVIEVKSSRANRDAVAQVVRYRSGLNAEFAAITAPSYMANAAPAATEHGVLLLDGKRTVDLLGALASHQALTPVRRVLEVSAA